MSGRQHDAPDCAVRNGVRNWTVHQYGYERYVVLNERGHEVAATHRRDTARLIAAAPDLLAALQQAEQQLDYGQIDAGHRIIIAAIARATGAA